MSASYILTRSPDDTPVMFLNSDTGWASLMINLTLNSKWYDHIHNIKSILCYTKIYIMDSVKEMWEI